MRELARKRRAMGLDLGREQWGKSRSRLAAAVGRATVAVAGLIAATGLAQAQAIQNEVAVFAALDKVTARIQTLEVPINQTLEFAALKVTPRVCNARPPTESPKTTTFVEIDEIELDGSQKRIFTGWMFAESPGLNALEHPVFDIWLTGCKEPIGGMPAVAAQPSAGGEVEPDAEGDLPAEDSEATPSAFPRRRIQR